MEFFRISVFVIVAIVVARVDGQCAVPPLFLSSSLTAQAATVGDTLRVNYCPNTGQQYTTPLAFTCTVSGWNPAITACGLQAVAPQVVNQYVRPGYQTTVVRPHIAPRRPGLFGGGGGGFSQLIYLDLILRIGGGPGLFSGTGGLFGNLFNFTTTTTTNTTGRRRRDVFGY